MPLKNFAAGLRNEEIESILLVGDSISDNNGASGHIYEQEQRRDAGCRLILSDEEEGAYYEDSPDARGWGWHFRNYLLENTSATTFHNNAIGGKSAKWFNAHREQAIPQDYDAIIVMLGTNDRWTCADVDEFYREYGEFLAYAADHCEYLQVFVPIPTFYSITNADEMNMDSRQIADAVLRLCEKNGYPCVNLYQELICYAGELGKPLDEFYFGSTHPDTEGYLHLWRLIARELGLNLDVGEVYDSSSVVEGVTDIGANREDISEATPLDAQTDGLDIFPPGVSLYWVGDSFPFKSDVAHGGCVVTWRYASGEGQQIFKPLTYRYDFIRYASAGGSWSEWFITNRDQFYRE